MQAIRPTIVLASQSPRRIELLQSSFNCKVMPHPSTFAENFPHSDFASPIEYVLATAREKALDVYSKLKQQQQQCKSAATTAAITTEYDFILSGDTCIFLGDKILEKPLDANHHMEMLTALAEADHHTVCTACCVVYPPNSAFNSTDSDVVDTIHDQTKVRFSLTRERIARYVQSGDGRDKAGGYGIQSGMLPCTLEGDYFTVVGLPLFCLSTYFQRKGINI